MPDVKQHRAPSRGGFARAIRPYVELARPTLCLSGLGSALVSYWLAIGRFDLTSAASAAALAVAFALAFANIVNDVIDVPIDRVNNARRPIASGRVTPRRAVALAGACGAASVTLGWIAGGRVLALTLAALALALLYDVWARKVPLLGNAIVALLGALTLSVGFALAPGGTFPLMPFLTSLLFILAREFVGTVCDAGGDRAGGRVSVAMLWGAGPVLAISLALALLSALAMCAAVLVRPVSRPALYLACACATSIAPTAAAAIAIWRDRSPDNIRRVSGRLKLVLMATTLSFLLLV